MLISAIFSLLLAALVSSNLVPQGNFTLLESRVLADGSATLHRIQEHGGDLPELPSLPEEDPELEQGVIVPLDANGNILPEFKHLVEPQVIEMSREQIQRLNFSMATVDKVLQPVVQPSPDVVPQQIEDEREIDTAGADYDEAAVPDSRLPLPKDYENSKEKDPEVETGDDGLREDELEKIEQEIQDRNGKEEVVPKEVMEDISAIAKEAEEELKEEIREEVETEKGAEEILEVLSEDVVNADAVEVKEEQKTEVNDVVDTSEKIISQVEAKSKDVAVVTMPPVKMETPVKETTDNVDEKPKQEEEAEESMEDDSSINRIDTIKGAADGAHILEKDEEDEVVEKAEAEEDHRPSRPLRGDVLFRRPAPDSSFVLSPSFSLFVLSLLCLW